MVYAYSSSTASRYSGNSAKTGVVTASFASLAIWALCYSIANYAPEEGSALLWRKLGVLGWGTIYSFMLHLALMMSGKSKWLKRRRTIAFIYLPALLNIWAFLLAPDAGRHFVLERYALGWISLWRGTFWNWFQMAHFAVFSVASIALIVQWHIQTKDPIEKRQSRLVMLAFGATVLLGAMTDYIFGSGTTRVLPQIGILFVLLPTSIFHYMIRKLAFIPRRLDAESMDLTQTLKDEARANLYAKFGYLLHFLGFVNLASKALILRNYTTHGLWIEGVLFSAVLVFAGTFVIHPRRFRASVRAQEFVLAVVSSGVIALGFSYYRELAPVAVWAAIFPLIIIGVVFSSPRVLHAAVGMQLLVHTGMWLLYPQAPVGLDRSEYPVRMIVIIMSAVLADFVNRAYRNRLRESEQSLRFAQAVADISRGLRFLTPLSFDDTMTHAMDTAARYLRCKRVIHLYISEGEVAKSHISTGGLSSPTDAFRERVHAAYGPHLLRFAQEAAEQDVFLCAAQLPADDTLAAYLREQGIALVRLSPIMSKAGETDVILAEVEDTAFFANRPYEDFFSILTHDLTGFLRRAAAERELRCMAYRDQLTGLNNRGSFMRILEDRIKSRREGESVSVMFIDVDAFKDVNDVAGHDVGNSVIRTAAARIRGAALPGDEVGRYGGDEFLYVTTRPAAESVARTAQALLAAFNQPVVVDQWVFHLTASIGIAIHPSDGDTAAVLLNQADFAMYDAKSGGRNRYCFYAREKTSTEYHALLLKNGLRNAIDRREFFLLWCPRVNLRTGAIAGAQAMVRWRHPTLGILEPSVFGRVSQEHGLDFEIGQLAIEMACLQGKEWLDMGLGPVRICIAMSAQQVLHPALTDMLAEKLRLSGMPPEYLQLDIPNSDQADYAQQTCSVVNALRGMGVRTAANVLPDAEEGAQGVLACGMDYAILDRLPSDELLVQEVQAQRAGLELLVAAARRFSPQVIATGIQSEAQYRLCQMVDVDEARGPYLFNPLLPDDLAEALRQTPDTTLHPEQAKTNL